MLAKETLAIRPYICLAKVVLMWGRWEGHWEGHENNRKSRTSSQLEACFFFCPGSLDMFSHENGWKTTFLFCSKIIYFMQIFRTNHHNSKAIYSKPQALITHKPFTDTTNTNGFINHYPYQPWYLDMYTHMNG